MEHLSPKMGIDLNQNEIEKQVAALGIAQPWNHNFLLPFGIETAPGEQKSHGKNLVKLERLSPLFDVLGVSGRRILDVGCNEGFFSVQMGRRGGQVLGIDVDTHRIDKARFIQSIVASDLDVQFRLMDIYSDEFENLPRFDLCLCLGFIHRVPDPYRAVAAIAARVDMIVFEWKALKFGPHDEAFAYFSQKGIDTRDYFGTEFWLLSYTALESILRRLGFRHFHRIDDPRQRRAIMVAGRHPHLLFDQPDQVVRGNLVRVMLSHGKRFVRTLAAIAAGRLNA